MLSPSLFSVDPTGGRIREGTPLISDLFASWEPPNTIYAGIAAMIASFTVFGEILSFLLIFWFCDNSIFSGVVLSFGFSHSTFGVILLILSGMIGFLATVFIHFHEENEMDHDYKVFSLPLLDYRILDLFRSPSFPSSPLPLSSSISSCSLSSLS